MPTSFGLAFGTVVLVILIFALGYANNVIYLFVFLLISVSITSMWLTNRNLEFIRFKSASAGDAFAREQTHLHISIENKGKLPAYAFDVSLNDVHTQITEISPRSEGTAQLAWVPEKRGWQAIPRLEIESTFPFDLLRTWRTYLSPEQVLVYPEKKGSHFFPTSVRTNQNVDSQGLFRELREYQSTDSVKRIDWRASTKHQKTLVKVFEGEASQSFEFTWEDTKHITHFEDRISQLALWIELCEKSGHSYALKIAKREEPLGKGRTHYRNCMRLLAELSMKDISGGLS